MSKITVAPAEGGKFQVLVDFIRNGIPYSTQALAELEAKKLYEKMYGKVEQKPKQN